MLRTGIQVHVRVCTGESKCMIRRVQCLSGSRASSSQGKAALSSLHSAATTFPAPSLPIPWTFKSRRASLALPKYGHCTCATDQLHAV
eukprot:3675668-Rhodomonas_salina.3